MIDTSAIHTCDFHHPQLNLPASGGQLGGPEAEFADRFASSYRQRFYQIHSGTSRRQTLFVREVPVPGNGIADLLVLSWNRPRGRDRGAVTLHEAASTVRAFEVKLSGWRGGLMQAHRYRYFSNAAILVVPRGKLKAVEAHLGLFQTLRVGLWGFDEATQTIINAYTPRPNNQQVAKYKAWALAAATKAASL